MKGSRRDRRTSKGLVGDDVIIAVFDSTSDLPFNDMTRSHKSLLRQIVVDSFGDFGKNGPSLLRWIEIRTHIVGF